VEFKNPNIPHGRGPLDPAHFTPYPKNPTICKFLIQLGRYEELGSGVNNVTKYLPFYAPGAGAPSFIEDDMFTTVVPLAPVAGEVTKEGTGEVAGEVKGEVAGEVMELLRVTKTAMSRHELQRVLKLKGQANFRDRYLLPALRARLIEMTVPDKPNSRLQKYRLTEKGRRVLGSAGGQDA
jgi:ATP-dependent DNA helicase RecG